MRALSIRQPYAEMILRGIKKVEYRSKPTKIVGERFWIYASKGPATKPRSDEAMRGMRAWSGDLTLPSDAPPPDWMLELGELLILGKLPTGVIVGSAVIEKVIPNGELFNWHLSDVQRIDTPRKPKGHPQPVWFRAF
jgi:hypothetical protein